MTLLSRSLLAAAACALAGCRSDIPDGPAPVASLAPAATSPAPAPSAPAPSAESDRRVSVALEDVEAAVVLQAAAGILALPLRVMPDAQPFVGCARVTVTTEGKVSPAEALLAVSRAVRPHGLVLFQGEDELIVKKARGHAAKPCARP